MKSSLEIESKTPEKDLITREIVKPDVEKQEEITREIVEKKIEIKKPKKTVKFDPEVDEKLRGPPK